MAMCVCVCVCVCDSTSGPGLVMREDGTGEAESEEAMGCDEMISKGAPGWRVSSPRRGKVRGGANNGGLQERATRDTEAVNGKVGANDKMQKVERTRPAQTDRQVQAGNTEYGGTTAMEGAVGGGKVREEKEQKEKEQNWEARPAPRERASRFCGGWLGCLFFRLCLGSHRRFCAG